MEMPRPTEAHRRLHQMAGSWKGEETVHPSPWDPRGGTATGAIESRVALDGFAVVQDYVQSKGGRPVFTGHAVFTWDASRGSYLMYWFDCMGLPPAVPSPGTWTDDAAVFVDENPMGRSRYTYQFPTPNEMTMKIEMSLDGSTWRPFLEGAYRREHRP